MNILMVSSYLPYPLDSGGHIRLYNIIKQLAKHHTITLICEKRDYQTDADVDELKKFCKKVITVPRKKQWSLPTILKTGFSLDPFLVTGHTHEDMKDAIKTELAKGEYNIIHVETFYVYQNLPHTMLPVVLVEHNIEYSAYARFVSQAPVSIRPLLSIDVQKLKRVEHAAWRKANAVVAVSETEQEQIQRPNVFVVPNGVDTEMFQFKKKKEKNIERILFIGNFSWMQNRDSVQWIVHDIWPRVQKALPKRELKLWIVGKNMTEQIRSFGKDPSIIIDENVPDAAAIFTRAAVLLAPIRVGAGTQYKILEAMASGTPVVTTQLGAVGLGAKQDEDVLIGEAPAEFVPHVVSLLTDEKLAARLAKSGRRLVEDNFTWEAIAKKLTDVYAFAIDPTQAALKGV